LITNDQLIDDNNNGPNNNAPSILFNQLYQSINNDQSIDTDDVLIEYDHQQSITNNVSINNNNASIILLDSNNNGTTCTDFG
jgi:hypothetical protein